MKQAIMRTIKAGARGIKVQDVGRLGGAEIARTEHNADGKVPSTRCGRHRLRAGRGVHDLGRIGVKVWIYRGECYPDQPRGEGAMREGADRELRTARARRTRTRTRRRIAAARCARRARPACRARARPPCLPGTAPAESGTVLDDGARRRGPRHRRTRGRRTRPRRFRNRRLRRP